MVEKGVKGKIIMTSSVAGLVSFIGYSAYSPTKSALRGAIVYLIGKPLI